MQSHAADFCVFLSASTLGHRIFTTLIKKNSTLIPTKTRAPSKLYDQISCCLICNSLLMSSLALIICSWLESWFSAFQCQCSLQIFIIFTEKGLQLHLFTQQKDIEQERRKKSSCLQRIGDDHAALCKWQHQTHRSSTHKVAFKKGAHAEISSSKWIKKHGSLYQPSNLKANRHGSYPKPSITHVFRPGFTENSVIEQTSTKLFCIKFVLQTL